MNKTVLFTVREYLDAHGLSAYALARAARGRVSERTVYALARGETTRVDLGTLGAVITTLEELTGEPVTAGDLLTTVTLPEHDPETAVWMNADLSRLGEFEKYDWGDVNPEELGEPIQYVPGVGLVAVEE